MWKAQEGKNTCERKILIGQVMLALMQMFVFALSIACVLAALAMPVFAREYKRANEVFDEACASATGVRGVQAHLFHGIARIRP